MKRIFILTLKPVLVLTFFQLILFLRFGLDSDAVFDMPDELDCAAAKYSGMKIRL